MPARGSLDRSLLRPVTGEPPPALAVLCAVVRDLDRSTASDLAPGARQPSAVIAGFCVPGRGCRSVMFASPRFGSGSLHLTSLILPGLIRGVLYGPGSSLRSASLCRRHLLQLAPRAMLRIALVAVPGNPLQKPDQPPCPEGGSIIQHGENASAFLRSPIPKGIPSGTGDGGAPPGARKGRVNL